MIELAGYDYLKQLGDDGNFGTVFHARNTLGGFDVAIKHIDEPMTAEALAAWEAEAHAMAACPHDNIVRILHAEVTADGPALVMEYLADGSVASRYGDEPAPVGAVVDIGIDVCWGLHRLHLEGLTHRDIKPKNLLLNGNQVKLGDFGLAGGHADLVELIYTAHRPPEVHHGGAWTEVADVYALGVTMWRLLSGDAYNGRKEPDLRARAAAGEWPNRDEWPPHIHKRLRSVLRSAMHPDPGKRPTSAADLRSAIEKARPVVSWVPTGVWQWSGDDGSSHWEVAVTTDGQGFYAETRRDRGRGARRVSAACLGPTSETAAEKAATAVLEQLAATGTVS